MKPIIFLPSFLGFAFLAFSTLICGCQSGEAPKRPESQLLYLQQRKDGKWEVVIDAPRRLRHHFFHALPDSLNFKIGEQELKYNEVYPCPHGVKIFGTMQARSRYINTFA